LAVPRSILLMLGVSRFLHLDDRSRTYGPYFSRETVGKLVAGL
jgi:hypothetical protein